MKHLLSYWERSVLLKPFDFAVLGAGLIGKQVAIRIKNKYPSARVALIDRSPISYGASTRNAGFACFGSVSEILDDLQISAEKDVIGLLEKRYKGINELVNTFGAETIGYRPTGSYEMFTDARTLSYAKEHRQMLNELLETSIGLKEAFHLKEDTMGMHCESECIYNPYEGMLNSGMLNETVSDVTHHIGIIPLYGLDIVNVQDTGNTCVLEASNGMTIQAGQLVIANNAFAGPFLPDEDIQPARGQIIITKPIDNLPFDGIFHSDKGYMYFRNIDGRILIGGGRNHFREHEQTFDFNGSDVVREYLENYLRDVVIPGREFEVDMHWSGIMAMGREKLPVVNRVSEHLLVCARMSGMGVALGPVLSKEIVDML